MRNGLPALGGGESSGQIRMSTHLYSKRKVCNLIFLGYKLIIRGGVASAFPLENFRKKDDSVMPSYQIIYDCLTVPDSKANLFYIWLKYKKKCPSRHQYTQYCL